MAVRAGTVLARMAKRRRALEAARRAFRLAPAQHERAKPDPMLAALRRGLARLALRDFLTGLGNRRDWDEQLSHELARARRSGEPLSVALLDLDGFKSFNDAHGHQAGDRLLIGAAAAWGNELREVDVLCRCGGDAFAALLPNCPRDQVDAVIARLVAATPSQQPCAAGAASWDGWETAHALLRRADQGLYNAKRVRQRDGNGRPAGTPRPAVS
jgi:diguanylate cyclase (GGDEF)-like protein